jgi:hypothetical protein
MLFVGDLHDSGGTDVPVIARDAPTWPVDGRQDQAVFPEAPPP